MELIPILSTIILVATISTFLLAIGAYVLYKVRERKGQIATAPQPSEVKAELVTTASAPAIISAEKQKVVPQQAYIERQPILIQQQIPQNQVSMQQRPQPYTVYGQAYGSRSTQPKQFAQPMKIQQRGFQGRPSGNTKSDERYGRDSKFMKYTEEGYVSTKDDKDSGALKWR